MDKKTCKDCLHCTIDGDEVLCVDMPWHYPFGGEDRTELDKEACEHFLERDKPTLFDQITRSYETLAEKLVVEYRHGVKDYAYYSTVTCELYNTKPEALAATVAKLKEVAKDD